MKIFLKTISLIVMMISCIYLSMSLFLNNLIINDVIPTVVDSSVVSEVLVDVSDNALSSMNVDESQTRQFVAMIQNDEGTQVALENYAETLINDVINQENTFDESEIIEQIEGKKDIAYELLQPNMTKEQFDEQYFQAMENLDLQQMHNTMVSRVSQTIEKDSTIKNVVVKIYDFHNVYHIYIAVILLLISTIYMIYSSIKEKSKLSNGIMLVYILCGILTLFIAISIVFVLSAIATSTMHIKISSIRYMYLCGAVYIFLGVLGYIINIFLKRKI